MGAVEVGIHPGAGLQLEDVPHRVECPDAGERGVDVADQALGRPLEDLPQGEIPGHDDADFGT